jgi:SAM-dependent methyltransferase
MTQERVARGIFVRDAGDSLVADSFYDGAYADGYLSTLGDDDRVYLQRWFRRLEGLRPTAVEIKLADIACGAGRLAEVCPTNWRITGTDWSSQSIEIARRQHPHHTWVVSDAHVLPLETSTFDFVSCFGSLEHFAFPDKALLEMKRILKPDGLVYLEVPNLFFPGYVLNYYYQRCSPGTDQPLERLAGKDGWEELARQSGFEVFDYWGRTYARGFSIRPVHRMLTWCVWTASRFFPAHMKENHCFLLRKIDTE